VYLHRCCYAVFDSCANTAISEGIDALSSAPPLSTDQTATVALIKAGHRTNAATEEATSNRLGFLRLTKGGQPRSDSGRLFAELAQERHCRPCPTAVSGPLDELRQGFVDTTLEVSLHAANKASARATFAKALLDKPPGHDPKAKKAAADKRKAAAAAPTTMTTGTKSSDGIKPLTEK
jgi:hypothetical protein